MSWAELLVKGAPLAVNGLKAAAKTVGNVGSFVVKNWKGVAATSAAGWVAVNKKEGEGVANTALRGLLNDNVSKSMEEKGLVGAANTVSFGSKGKDKSVLENITDAAAGEGTYNKTRNAVGAVVDEGVGAYQGAKEKVSNLTNDTPAVGTGGASPSMESQYASVSPYNGVNDYIGRMTNGNVSNMNAIELAVAAYMMFSSRFGWLAKAGGAVLGGVATKDITSRQQQRYAQQQAMLQQNYDKIASQQPSPQSGQSAPETLTEPNYDIIHRNR